MGGADNDSFWEKHKPEKDESKDKQPMLGPFNRGQLRFSLWYLVGGIIFLMLMNSIYTEPRDTIIQYNEFKDHIENGEIVVVEIHDQFLRGLPRVAEQAPAREDAAPAVVSPSFPIYRTARVDDPGLIPLLDESGVDYYAVPTRETPLLNMLLGWVLPFVLLMIVWRFMFKRMGGVGQNVMSFGKNNAQIVAEGETGVRFADVAGVDEAKAELEEVVDFLERPQRYTAIGGKIPKGVLLVGPPGTGKTMLAKAVAGEAGVPFFRMSGADFVEMFVGVGAARVRDLFRQAREKAPCIIFIDELDAIGKSRVQAVSSNDEREQTLNQLLVEMDGFDSRAGVILLGATNRPEILDPALLRPGRFDRQVVVDKPDVAGREAILKIHVRGVTLADDVDLGKVARSTPGLVGADLANIVNEAALLAVRSGREAVSQDDLMSAIEKTIGGLEKKNKLINPVEREIVAYHETGHAVIAHLTTGADPVEKITIVPRGIGALGYTLQLPTEERYLLTEDELLGKIDVLLGGRAAEQVVFGRISTGAANDINRASDMARKMITEYGMSKKFTNVYLPSTRPTSFLRPGDGAGATREYSESTQTYIDEETARIIAERYQRVVSLLESRRDGLERVAKKLMEKETLDRAEFASLLGESGTSA